MTNRILVKLTADGRRLEVVGPVLCLDGKLVADGLMAVAQHPMRARIREIMPDATHMAGRVALNRAEAEIAEAALRQAEARILANPAAIHERFRLAAHRKAGEQGIE